MTLLEFCLWQAKPSLSLHKNLVIQPSFKKYILPVKKWIFEQTLFYILQVKKYISLCYWIIIDRDDRNCTPRKCGILGNNGYHTDWDDRFMCLRVS